MAKVSLTIDGKRIETVPGKRLLDVAREHGIDIPTLCDDPRLEPFGACRMCLVEVEGARGPVASCGTTVSAGMVVNTCSDEIKTLRTMALELLASNHYGDCIAPCSVACPAGIDIQGYIGLLAEGKNLQALQLIKERMPLPAICGRVCPKFCEEACRRNIVDEPVAICWLKRFAGDEDLDADVWQDEVAQPTDKKVAIVGSGPAGLTAAYYLALAGHEITMYEGAPELGGMMRYGIPAYRLPRDILDREIATITRLCKEVKVNQVLGCDFTLQSLRDEGFDAVFVAIGAQSNQEMGIKGEDLDGVLAGVKMLQTISSGAQFEIGSRVCVVGGGNTAMDAARNALRLGAEKVTIIYRRSEEEMPASHEEVEQAKEEGIEFLLLTNPAEFVGENGKLTSVRCVKMELGEPDASGRRRPVPVEGSEFDVKADQVVTAIGQVVDPSGLDGVKLDKWDCVVTDRDTMQTPTEWLFSAGDCVTGPKTVVEAVGAARKAAVSMNDYLHGRDVKPEVKPYNATRGELDEIDPEEYKDEPKADRAEMPMVEPEKRKTNYNEIELGFDAETVKKECQRCLSCGCDDVFDCTLRDLATEYGIKERFGIGDFDKVRFSDHPYILRDQHKCVLCGNCVRICAEIQDVAALGFVHRAFETRIAPALELPLQDTQCESCTQCISSCPTGALSTRPVTDKPGPYKTTAVQTTCPHCSVGCELELNVAADRIISATSPLSSIVSKGCLCERGAFGYRFVHGPHRLTEPMVRKNGTYEAVSWDEAIKAAADGLAKAKDDVAVLASGKLTLEQAYVAGKLARCALDTNNIDGLRSDSNYVLSELLGMEGSTCTFEDLDASDLVMAYGVDLAKDYPVLANRVRKLTRTGTKLISINSQRTKMDKFADATIGVNARKAAQMLELMLDYVLRNGSFSKQFAKAHEQELSDLKSRLDDDAVKLLAQQMWTKPEKVISMLTMYLQAERPVIIVDAGTISRAELGLLTNLAAITDNLCSGSGLIVLRADGNAQGLLLAGASPCKLPGQRSLSDAAVASRWQVEISGEKGLPSDEIKDSLAAGGIKGVVIVDSDMPVDYPDTSKAFTVVIAPGLPEDGLDDADVILPGVSFAETDGTVINAEGRWGSIKQAIDRRSEQETIDILCRLSQALGYEMDYDSAADVRAELAVFTDECCCGGVKLFTDLMPVDDVTGD